jgi:EAL domain-containing protein (putative c-di-GMP-specific phosphodiesterase class I)/GGDEF domain-containing protein
MAFTHATRFYVLSAFIFSCFYSPLLFSADSAFTFVEFNIAFVLGLTLPVLLIVMNVRPTPLIKRRYPLLLSSALLAMLYSLAYLRSEQNYAFVSFASLFLLISYFWSQQQYQEKISRIAKSINSLLVLLYIINLYLLWSATISINTLWLVLVISILVFAITKIVSSAISAHTNDKREIIQWLILSGFVCCIYFWLNMAVNDVAIIIACVLCYSSLMVNSCWHVIMTLSKYSQLKENEGVKQLPVESFTFDPATNLPTYKQALKQFEQKMSQNLQSKYVAIAFKPTNFNQVNEVLGHHNSDILLLQLAYCLQKCIEKDEELVNFSNPDSPIRIARLQGLHFLIFLDTSLSKHGEKLIIEQLCNKLKSAVPGPMSFKSFSLYFELAFGAAFVGQHSNSLHEVIAFAEDALLAAEKSHSLLSYFDHDKARFNELQLLKMDKLKRDIHSDKLNWHVEPQLDLITKKIIGFEVKVFWQDTNKDIKPLEAFIELAEHSGDIYLLTQQMIIKAFEFAAKAHSGEYYLRVAIQLSSAELLEHALVDFIESQAKANSVDCKLLVIEVKETILLQASQRAKTIIDQLKSLGVQIAISDFSGSYEALRYLRRLAVSQIKIDCSILANTKSGSPDKAIINALINLTRKMNLPLIGTHIDNAHIEQVFSQMGGELAQGQYFSKGVNYDELTSWLDTWQKQYPIAPTL